MYERTGTLVRKKFQEHLLPTMLTSMAMSLASVVDGAIVGQLLGSDALAAIGLAGPLIFCINILYMLFAVGGMTCASIARGKRDMARADRFFSATFLAGGAAMLLFLIVAELLLAPITLLLAAGDASMARLTAAYLRPLLFTGPLLLLSSGAALFMRADGKPKRSAVIVIAANAVNLVFDYVLIRFFDTGIMGAGLSTSLGYAVGVLIVLPYLLNHKAARSFRFVRPAGLFEAVASVVHTGLPKGFTQIASFGRALVLNSLVMQLFGALGMSVMTVLTNSLMLANIFIGGTGDTLLPIVGTLYGEGDLLGVRRTVASARRVLIVASAALVAFFALAPGAMGALFGLDTPEGLALLAPALQMFAIYVPLYAAVITLQNFYNTTGRVRLASTIALLDGFLFVCGYAQILKNSAPDYLWLCYALGSGTTLLAILYNAAYIRKKEGVLGLLLLPEAAGEAVWDITIDGTAAAAVGLSERVLAIAKERGVDAKLGNHMAVALEEMALATAHYAHHDRAGEIDIMIRAEAGGAIARFRDDGDPFDPVAYQPDAEDGLITDGVALIRALASEVGYSRQLGFNTTTLRFDP